MHSAFKSGGGVSVDGNTKFRIGSMSKFFTGILIRKLELNENRPELRQTKLKDILKEYELKSIFGGNASRAGNITLQQLMDQTTGIRVQKKEDEQFKLDERQDLFERETFHPSTSELLLACDQGLTLEFNSTEGEFQYSNFNATLAGVALERVFDKPFYKLMQQSIFDECGMTSSGYDVPNQSSRATSGAESYSDSRFFDASSHIWTTSQDLVTFFKYLNQQPELTHHIKAGAPEGVYYSGFSKINTTNGSLTIGVDGGRDGMGSSAHQDPEGNTIIAIGTGGAGDMDALTQKMATLMGMSPFSGDPTVKGRW